MALLDAVQAAKQLDITPATFRLYVARRAIPCSVSKDGRVFLWDSADLDRVQNTLDPRVTLFVAEKALARRELLKFEVYANPVSKSHRYALRPASVTLASDGEAVVYPVRFIEIVDPANNSRTSGTKPGSSPSNSAMNVYADRVSRGTCKAGELLVIYHLDRDRAKLRVIEGVASCQNGRYIPSVEIDRLVYVPPIPGEVRPAPQAGTFK